MTAPCVLRGTHTIASDNLPFNVKYTLDLNNNTLFQGNVAPTSSLSAPFDITFDSSNSYLYVADFGSGVVAVIDGTTNKILTSIAVGGHPYTVDFDPSSGYLYAAESSGNLAVIDGASNKVVGNIPIPVINGPSGVAFDPTNRKMFVADRISQNVSIISTASNKIVGSVGGFETYGDVYALAFDTSSECLYVVTYVPPYNSIHDLPYFKPNNVLVLNDTTGRITGNVTVEDNGQPYGIVYVSSNGDGVLTSSGMKKLMTA